jgi:hypothetical protein
MMKSAGSKQMIAGTVQVTTSTDCSQLVGNCPTCHARLSVEIRSDGTFGGLVACMRCKQIYRVQSEESPGSPEQNPSGFGVSYVVVGTWDLSSIMEYLFDNVGPVKTVADGFVCQPDENHVDFPFITVNQGARTIRFSLFGHYQEREAASVINQVVSEFGNRFQLDLYPLLLERWEYQGEAKGFTLVEQRQLGALLRERVSREAHA